MLVRIIILILALFAVIRTVAYGIYCAKNTGALGCISVFVLAAGIIAAAGAVY